MDDLTAASDAVLAQRSADGDVYAFGVLVRRHAPFLHAYATRLTGSRADADDAVQDALIAAWGALDSLDDPGRVRAWLTSIVSRKATDRIRSRKQHGVLDEERAQEPELGPEHRAITRSQLDALDAVLAGLPESQRRCWMLREVGGYSYEEIAERLGTTPVVVRGRLARAREAVVMGMEVWR